MSTRTEVRRLCKESLQSCHVGTGEQELQNGKDFYKYFFTNFPDLRKYFKGAEHYTAEDVQGSERFEKQGQRLIVACHVIANLYDDDMAFKAYCRETVNRHRIFKLDPELWKAFFVVWTGFLDTKKKLTDQQRAAWMKLGEDWAAEAIQHQLHGKK